MGSAAAWVLTAAALLLLVPTGYLFVLTLFSGKLPRPAAGPGVLRFDVIVPAHDESAGISRTVENLHAVAYPRDRFRVLVVADNCTDDTAAKAAAAGATVLERFDAEKRGKGHALAFAFERSLADGAADAVVVVDADTLVTPNLLSAFEARLAAGARAVQAHYGVANAMASWRTRLMSIAFTTFHAVRSLARERFGVSCGLRGNGMCFSHALIREIPHEAFSLVEDLEYGIRLGRAGHRVVYAHEAEVLGEMVSSEKASRSQRRRWEGGRMRMAKEQGFPLLLESFSQASALRFDLAMDVLVPPLSLLVNAAVLGLVACAVAGMFGVSVARAASLFLTSLVVLVVYVARGWYLSGVGARGLVDLASAPLYLAWKLKLALMPEKTGKDEWVRTAREGETRPPDGTP